MDKDTKIELLKVFGMIIILVVLICGIVWINKAQDLSVNETNSSSEEFSNTETNNSESSEEKENSNKDSDSKSEKEKKDKK